MRAQAWVDLSGEDLRRMLISLIGNRFGEKPEEHLDEIREERANYAKSFIKMGGIKQSDKVLDLGSGCGFGTAVIARNARKVIACDISPAYLEFARHECASMGNVQFHTITNHRLSTIDSQSLDAVISMAVFIHMNLYDIYHYFNEFSRILKPGGKVLIDFADMNRLFSRIPNRGQDQQFLSCAGHYHNDPNIIAGLMQWNSARGIKGVARSAGFNFIKRRGHKLMFKTKVR